VIRRTILRLIRSGAAGILATITDVGVLMALVSFAGMPKVTAGIPSLILGSIVMFLGHKYFVFDARRVDTLGRETVLFVVVQVIGIALSTWVFKVLLGLSPRFEPYYVLVRLVANNLVWLFYFFPLWHFVFRSPATPEPAKLP
jgi:putative flippase GtrA